MHFINLKSLLTLSLVLGLTTAQSATAKSSTRSVHSTTLKSSTRPSSSFTALPSGTAIPAGSSVVNISDVWVPTNLTSSAPAAIQNVSIVIPPPLDPSDDNDHPIAKSVGDTFPHLLAQLGVDPAAIPDLVAEAIPIIKDAVLDSLNGSTAVNSTDTDPGPGINSTLNRRHLDLARELHRRSIFSAIGNFFKKILPPVVGAVEDAACSVFAAGAVPGYLVSADLFRIENLFKASHASTLDQDFYIFPLHGSVSHDDHISIIYGANFPPGFGSAIGVTMGRTIYVRGAEASDAANAGFKYQTKYVLLHEFTHIKQYQALGYNLPAFGLKYLYEYCKAGFSYTGDSLEVEAYTKQEYMNALLTDPIGFNFIQVWKRRGLQNSLGLPTARTYKTLGGNRFALDFQKGTLTITCVGTSCT